MRTLLLFLALLFTPSLAQAQDKPALLTFSLAATADWATTYHVNTTPRMKEENPMISWLRSTPKAMVLTGAAIDVASVSVWYRVTRSHKTLRTVGLYGATAFRIFFAVRNEKRYRVEMGRTR